MSDFVCNFALVICLCGQCTSLGKISLEVFPLYFKVEGHYLLA